MEPTSDGRRWERRSTYEMYPNPPARMPWKEYEGRVLAEWQGLLDSQEGCDEKKIQRFLTDHPSMVPGAYNMTRPSGAAPFPNALLCECPLSAIGVKIPDFMWLAWDSLNFTPVLIEIESPCKRWFTQAGVPTHELTQAANQLAEWSAWLNRPQNVLVFYDSFEIPSDLQKYNTFRPEFVLIYGRRREFQDRPELSRLRSQFERYGQVAMTFDRLKPAQNCDSYLSATRRNGHYSALSVPATLELGPMVAKAFARIDKMPEAIERNQWISGDRRRFLVERLAYWNEWAKLEDSGVICTGDWE
ncbi:MAG: Shedu anti-phage system protein SduA domain-containing protein [Terriglobia bacterium]